MLKEVMQRTFLLKVSHHLPLDAIFNETDKGGKKPTPIRKAVRTGSDSLSKETKLGECCYIVGHSMYQFQKNWGWCVQKRL
jgi:hypothetical protein